MIYNMCFSMETHFDFRLSFIILGVNVDQIDFVLSFNEDHLKGHLEWGILPNI